MDRTKLFSYFLGVLAFVCASTVFNTSAVARSTDNEDSIAVIIGNRDYKRTFGVDYAHNDALAMKDFLIHRLGFQDKNIILEKDATMGTMTTLFGDKESAKGQLYNWVRPGRSNVFVFYSGHGAPHRDTKKVFLIPTDIDPEYASRGYALDVLYQNLKVIKKRVGSNRSVVLMMDACFSGQIHGNRPLQGVSGALNFRIPTPSDDIVQLSASSGDEVANWDEQMKHGLFTGQFLRGVRGDADKGEYGNRDGRVTWPELRRFLSEEVTYLAMRRTDRTQTPELADERSLRWDFEARETDAERDARNCRDEKARWVGMKSNASSSEIENALQSFKCPDVRQSISETLRQMATQEASARQTQAESDQAAALEEMRRELQRLRTEREEEQRRRAEEEERRRLALLEEEKRTRLQRAREEEDRIAALRRERKRLEEQRRIEQERRRSQPQFRVYPNVDFYGRDMRNYGGAKGLRNVSADVCRQTCANEPRCVAFNYAPRHRRCWIKDGLGRRDYDPIGWSEVKSEYAPD